MSNQIIPPNLLKRRLREGRTAVGTMLVEVRQPSIMQVLANAGMQFVLIDAEHGPFTLETIADLSRSAQVHGITPIVRVPDISYAAVTQALDAGAQGIMVPRITEPGQVEDVVHMMKYPPTGRRGSVLMRGHTAFRSGPLADAMKAANEESMLVVQIETAKAVECLDAILSVQGVDAALVGPTDLSVALGIPGEMDHQRLASTIATVVDRCTNHGVIPAIQMNDIDRAVRWASAGMRMVSISSEIGLLIDAGVRATKAVAAGFAAK